MYLFEALVLAVLLHNIIRNWYFSVDIYDIIFLYAMEKKLVTLLYTMCYLLNFL